MTPTLSIETSQHRLTLFADTAAFWVEVEAALETAQHSVWLSTYIYRDDACGTDFGERLERAAARGLDVRLLYDPQGSRGTNARFFAGLRQRGVRVKAYRPWRLRRELWKYFPRDHGRLLIIDDVAYTGGINWGDEWLPIERGGGDWHDVSVSIRGPCVVEARTSFAIRWAEANSLLAVADHLESEQDGSVEFLADSPRGVSVIYQRLCAAVAKARHSVYIENSYCVPPRGFIRLFADAAARGVEVRLLLPGRTTPRCGIIERSMSVGLPYPARRHTARFSRNAPARRCRIERLPVARNLQQRATRQTRRDDKEYQNDRCRLDDSKAGLRPIGPNTSRSRAGPVGL